LAQVGQYTTRTRKNVGNRSSYVWSINDSVLDVMPKIGEDESVFIKLYMVN